MKDFDHRFDRAFSMVAFVANRHLVEHMRRVGQELRLDLDSAFLLGLLSHLSVVGALGPGTAPADVLKPDGYMVHDVQGIRLADLTQVSGLPRETVRRKLNTMKSMGLVQRTDDGLWQFVGVENDHLTREFTRSTVKRLLQTAREIESLLERAGA